ncbi:Fc.00g002270.m01.CDS01 [Cosmosporella sp. VM-42]
MRMTSDDLSREYARVLQLDSTEGNNTLPLVGNDSSTQSGPKVQGDMKTFIQCPRERYGDDFDVVPAERYRRRKLEDPDGLFQHYSLIIRRILSYEGRLKSTRLEIQSKGLCKLIQAIGEHLRSMINLDTRPIVVEKPFKVLLFLLKPLEHYLANGEPEVTLKEEVELLLRFIKSADGIQSHIKEYAEQIELGKVSHGLLWALYPPGTIVYSSGGTYEECEVIESTEYSYGDEAFQLHTVFGSHTGQKFGISRMSRNIKRFARLMDISIHNLSAVPLRKLPKQQQSDIQNRLIARGKRFVDLQEANATNLSYAGPFWAFNPAVYQKTLDDNKQVQIIGRVVVDATAVRRLNLREPDEQVAPSLQRHFRQHSSSPKSGTSSPADSDDEDGSSPNFNYKERDYDESDKRTLTDDEYLICRPDIDCFFLPERHWGRVLVQNLTDIEWNGDAFEQLQMLSSKKSFLRTLVTGFDPNQTMGFDDAIEDKGGGLIFLLHGEPGLGKTMTAESIAESAHLPLYHVTTGQLSTDISELETQLQNIFMLGQRWKAVLLLDEADVLMSQRTLNDLNRNGIVAVFLRLIEYYKGLLFLTTNRLEGFDTTFYNRIHVKITYPQLDHEARSNIWRNLLTRSKVPLDESWSADLYRILGQLKTNGRDIRNIIKIAKIIADGSQDAKFSVEKVVAAMHINCSGDAAERSREIDCVSEQLKTYFREKDLE